MPDDTIPIRLKNQPNLPLAILQLLARRRCSVGLVVNNRTSVGTDGAKVSLDVWLPYPGLTTAVGGNLGKVISIDARNTTDSPSNGTWVVLEVYRPLFGAGEGKLPKDGSEVDIFSNQLLMRQAAEGDSASISYILKCWVDTAQNMPSKLNAAMAGEFLVAGQFQTITDGAIRLAHLLGIDLPNQGLKGGGAEPSPVATQEQVEVIGKEIYVEPAEPMRSAPLQMKPGYTRIGYAELIIPPESIEVSEREAVSNWQAQGMGLLRARGSILKGLGHAQTMVTMNIVFDSTDTIQRSLIPLIEQCQRFPFLPIENYLLNFDYDIDALAIVSLSISTVPSLPEAIRATLVGYKFNWGSYIPQETTYDGSWCYPLFRVWCEQRSSLRQGGAIYNYQAKPTPRPTIYEGPRLHGFADNLVFEVVSDKDVQWEMARRRAEEKTGKEAAVLLTPDEEVEVAGLDYHTAKAAADFAQIRDIGGAVTQRMAVEYEPISSAAGADTYTNGNKPLVIYMEDDGVWYALLRLRDPNSLRRFVKSSQTFSQIFGSRFYHGVKVYATPITLRKSGTIGVEGFMMFKGPQNKDIDLRNDAERKSIEDALDGDPYSTSSYTVRIALHQAGRQYSNQTPPELDSIITASKDKAKEYDRRKQSGKSTAPDTSQKVKKNEPIPVYESVLLSSKDLIVTQIAGEFSNIFAELQLQSDDCPTYQYMGGTNAVVRIEAVVADESVLTQIQDFSQRVRSTHRNLRGDLQRNGVFYGSVKVSNPVLNGLLGITYCIPVTRVISTEPGVPGVHRVVIDLIGHEPSSDDYETLVNLLTDKFDTLQQPQFLEDAREDDSFSKAIRWENYRQRLGLAELYPDLRLPRHCEATKWLEGIAVGTWDYWVGPDASAVANSMLAANQGNGFGFEDPDFFISTDSRRYDEMFGEIMEEALANDQPAGGSTAMDVFSNAGEAYTLRLLQPLAGKAGAESANAAAEQLNEWTWGAAAVGKSTTQDAQNLAGGYDVEGRLKIGAGHKNEKPMREKMSILRKEIFKRVGSMPKDSIIRSGDSSTIQTVENVLYALFYSESHWMQFTERTGGAHLAPNGNYVGITQCPRTELTTWDTEANLKSGVNIFFSKVKLVEPVVKSGRTTIGRGCKLIQSDSQLLAILFNAVALYKGLAGIQGCDFAAHPHMVGSAKNKDAFFPVLERITKAPLGRVDTSTAQKAAKPAAKAQTKALPDTYVASPASISKIGKGKWDFVILPEGKAYQGMELPPLFWVASPDPKGTLRQWGKDGTYTAIIAPGGMYILAEGWQSPEGALAAFRAAGMELVNPRSRPTLMSSWELPEGVSIGAAPKLAAFVPTPATETAKKNLEKLTPEERTAIQGDLPSSPPDHELPYQISDAFAGLLNPTTGKRDIKHSMFHDMLTYSRPNRLVQAFPSYYFALVDGGQRVRAWRLWDRCFGLRSAVSIDVFKERGNPVHTCIVALSDVLQNLSDSMADVKREELNRKNWRWTLYDVMAGIGDAVFPTFDFSDLHRWAQHIDSLLIKTGTRIHLRMGWGSDASLLPVVFNGTIAETEISEGMVQLICQGDGVELVQNLTDTKRDERGAPTSTFTGGGWGGDDPGKLVRDMFLDWGEGFFGRILQQVGGFRYQNKYSIEHFGTKLITLKGFFNEGIGEPGMNIYSSRTDQPRIYPRGLMDRLDVAGAIHWWQHTTPTTIKVEEATVWKISDACAKLVPDFMCDVHPFDLRSTFFFGKTWWPLRYGYNTDGAFGGKLNPDNVVEVNDAAGVGDDPFIGRVTDWKPFQQIHFIQSHLNVLGNTVATSEEEVFTSCIAVNMHSEKGDSNLMRVDPYIWPEKQKTMLVQSCSTDSYFGTKVPAGQLNPLMVSEINNTSAANHLREAVSKMYTGYFITLGIPSIKPRDVLSVTDVYREMTGVCEVREAHHTLSLQNGFISLIRPSCCTVTDDMDYMTALMWLGRVNQLAFGVLVAMKTTNKLMGFIARKFAGDGAVFKNLSKLSELTSDGAKWLEGTFSKILSKNERLARGQAWVAGARKKAFEWVDTKIIGELDNALKTFEEWTKTAEGMKQLKTAANVTKAVERARAAAEALKAARASRAVALLEGGSIIRGSVASVRQLIAAGAAWDPLLAVVWVAIMLGTGSIASIINRKLNAMYSVFFYPLIVRGHEYSAGLNGHRGSMVGDSLGAMAWVCETATTPSLAGRRWGWAGTALSWFLNLGGIEPAKWGGKMSGLDYFGDSMRNLDDEMRSMSYAPTLSVGAPAEMGEPSDLVGPVHANGIQVVDTPAIGQKAANTAASLVGQYGNGRWSDCSSFVRYVFYQVGINVGGDSRDQARRGRSISESELQAGDRLYWATGHSQAQGITSHCTIYDGRGNLVYGNPGAKVRMMSLASFRKQRQGAKRGEGSRPPYRLMSIVR